MITHGAVGAAQQARIGRFLYIPHPRGEMTTPAKVEVRGLTKIFGDAPAAALDAMKDGQSREDVRAATGQTIGVREVSFEVAAGETFVVMGLSGSGKSTLIRCINRLIEPTEGQVLVDGRDVTAASAEELRELRLAKLAMVFQHFALFPHKSVSENVEYGLKIKGVKPDVRRAKALEALDMVSLAQWADSPPDALSGGMKQRVGIARALATDTDVLLMDEPFSALDPLIRRDMQDDLIELQDRFHKSIIFITHDLNEALKLGDRIAIMKEGRFVQVGTTDEIVNAPADPYVAAFTRDVDRTRVVTVDRVMRDATRWSEDKVQPERVIAALRQPDCSEVFVTCSHGKPVGMLLEDDVTRLVKAGSRDFRDVVRREFSTVEMSATLADSFEACERNLPIAVIDGTGRLRGVVRPLDLLAELAGNRNAA